MTKAKTNDTLDRNAFLDILAEFYHNIIKPEMATKEDLKQFATKQDLERFATKDDLKRFATKQDLERFATKRDLQETENRLMREIKGNTRLIDNVEIALADRSVDHEKRIKKLEGYHTPLTN